MNIIMLSIAIKLVRLLEFLLFARAIMSWFAQSSGSQIYEFLQMITEPLIAPFRALINNFEFARRCPIDISFLVTFFALELVLTLLYRLA